MRTSVAILETRPETVVQDYGRLLKLVGFQEFCGDVAPVLVPGIRENSWFPGRGTPPWQLEGVLAGCAANDCISTDDPITYMVVSSGKKKTSKAALRWGWDAVLRQRGITALGADAREPLPYRPQGHFPALEAILDHGLALPPALWDRPVIMLPVPGLGRRQPLFGCIDLLGQMLRLPQAKGQRKIPRSEILAELLGYVRDCLPNSFHVMDAVIWDVPRGKGGNRPVLKHIVLAGKDPLAVDSTAMRLMGFEPTSLSWVRLASERGAGVAKRNEISILGQPELLDLDFQKRNSNLTSVPDWENPFWMKDESRLAKWLWQLTGRTSEIKKFRDTSWGSLFETFQLDK